MEFYLDSIQMSKIRPVILLAMVALAGCTGQPTTGQQTGVATVETSTNTATHTVTATPTPVPPNNPWRKKIVYVSVNNTVNDRDFTPLVNETLRYWNQNAEAYGNYEVTFRLAGDNHQPDITVQFVSTIDICESKDTDRTVGCAPILSKDSRLSSSATVKIKTGYINSSTEKTLKHEFGHVLGISHGEDPMPLMAERGPMTMVPQPNATERAFPWQNKTLSVYIDYENVSLSDTSIYEYELTHTLAYYADGADGTVAEGIEFTSTENRTAANIVILFPDELNCTDRDEGSCGRVHGYNLDADQPLEYFSQYTITVTGIDRNAIGWWVGYWLADAFGLIDTEELPPPFVDADYRTTHSDWWK